MKVLARKKNPADKARDPAVAEILKKSKKNEMRIVKLSYLNEMNYCVLLKIIVDLL